MSVNPQNDVWQVEVGGQIYEAPLGELPEWIGEGSLQPDDKVRKGNLRWIEARKVPALVPFFNARDNGEPMPVIQTVTDATPIHEVVAAPQVEPSTASNSELAPAVTAILLSTPAAKPASLPGMCSNHPGQAAVFVCSACSGEFCKACPRSYGGSVRICPDCGSMCKSIEEFRASATRESSIAASSSEPFGFADLGRAFSHPFKFKSSFFFGGLMFMFFTLGQSAAAIGGIFLFAAAIFCAMLANMLWFGVLANTVDNFTQGRLDVDFMPSFENFSLWDDVIHPFFLSIAAYLSAFGPLLLVVVIGAYLIFSAATEQMQKFNRELSRVPGTQFYAPDRTAEQSQEVKDVLARSKQLSDRRLELQKQYTEAAESGEAPPAGFAPAPSEQELAEFEQLAEDTRRKQLESLAPGGTDDAAAANYAKTLAGILRLAAPLVVIGFLALLWGLIYFPAACAVAGYSRSFIATINPLTGLDTMKRLGGSYVKLLLMGFLILMISGFITGVLEIVLSPFNLPQMGNLPAKALGSFVTFYFSIVFSCLIGYMLFKNADKLKLYR